MSFHVPNHFRVRRGVMASDDSNGNNGMFFVPNRAARPRGLSTRGGRRHSAEVIASDGALEEDGLAWEHVSISLPMRCPTWDEMCFIKSLFWDDEDCVMQLHPPRSQWVNNHSFCLHLWRSVGKSIPQPPSLMVGYKEARG